MRFSITVSTLVHDGNGSLVLVKEKKPRRNGQWSNPQGRLEIGEDLFEGALREIKEETGLSAELVGLLAIFQKKYKDTVHGIKFLFVAEAKHADLIFPEDEILDAKWLTFEEFEKFPDKELCSMDIRKGYENLRADRVLPLEHHIHWSDIVKEDHLAQQ